MSDLLNAGIKAAAYILLGMILCYAGKRIRALFGQWRGTDAGIVPGRNNALALSAGSYYLAVLLSLGGPISWASDALWPGLGEALAFGLMAVVLLNVSMLIAEKTYLGAWELSIGLNKGDLCSGLAEGAHYISFGLMIMGASWGDSGGSLVMFYFWLLGQVLLGIAVKAYFRFSPFNVPEQVRKGNFPAALSLDGAVIAIGNIARASLSGPFLGWVRSTLESAGYFVFGLAALLGARYLADVLLFPKATFNEEIFKNAPPNQAAGILDALLLIGVSTLLGWVLG